MVNTITTENEPMQRYLPPVIAFDDNLPPINIVDELTLTLLCDGNLPLETHNEVTIALLQNPLLRQMYSRFRINEILKSWNKI